MGAWFATFASALGLGFAGALVPLVAVEAAVLAYAALLEPSLAWAAAVALAIGQTAGKTVVYQAFRSGRALTSRWTRHRAGAIVAERPGRFARLRRWWAAGRRLAKRLEALLSARWPGRGVILLSAGLGFPPLAATTAIAGIVRMARADFIIACLIGRLARFAVIAWPILSLVR